MRDGLSDGTAWRAVTVLAFTAGGVDAVGVAALSRFVSHMSGTTTTLSLALTSGRADLAALCVVVLLAFSLGASATGVAVTRDRWRDAREAAPILLWAEAALIAAAALIACVRLGELWRTAAVAIPLAAAMGCQNRTGVILAGGKARTTHVTGTLTDLGYHTGRLLRSTATARASRAEDVAAAYRLLALFTGFLAGGLVGYTLVKFGGAAIVAGFAPLPAMVGAVVRARTRSSSPA